jgi:hypothetical protein
MVSVLIQTACHIVVLETVTLLRSQHSSFAWFKAVCFVVVVVVVGKGCTALVALDKRMGLQFSCFLQLQQAAPHTLGFVAGREHCFECG